MEDPRSSRLTALECGAAVRLPSAGPVTLTGLFPSLVNLGDGAFSGTVALHGTTAPVRGVVVPAADVFLVRDGLVVTLPLPQDSVGRQLDLPAGSTERLSAHGTLSPCGREDHLTPGPYDVYARVVVGHADGTTTEAVGGPWSMQVL
jgi:hypothetical protein